VTRTRRWWLALATVVVLAAAGSLIWSNRADPDYNADPGPLTFTDDDAGRDCFSLSADRTFAVKLGDLQQGTISPSPVLSQVRLGDADGVAVDDAALVPSSSVEAPEGGTPAFPQGSRPLPVQVPPPDQDVRWALDVHLRVTGNRDTAEFAVVRLEYSIGDQHYLHTFSDSLSASNGQLCYGSDPNARYPG
jgi:hypothetical protein